MDAIKSEAEAHVDKFLGTIRPLLIDNYVDGYARGFERAEKELQDGEDAFFKNYVDRLAESAREYKAGEKWTHKKGEGWLSTQDEISEAWKDNEAQFCEEQ